MRIDAHAHVIVPEVLREAWGPRVRWEDGAQVVELGGRQIRSAVRDFVAIEQILAAQADAGIDSRFSASTTATVVRSSAAHRPQVDSPTSTPATSFSARAERPAVRSPTSRRETAKASV